MRATTAAGVPLAAPAISAQSRSTKKYRTALSAGRILGANERINVGVIGVGLIGRILTRGFVAHPNVQVVGIAETYKNL
jgi:hypothetical protein